MNKTGYLNDGDHKLLNDKCVSIRAILVASIKTAKENAKADEK